MLDQNLDEYDDEDKINAILSWKADEKPDFDDLFVLEMQQGLEKYGKLFPSQTAALDRIIGGFRIDMERWT